MELNVLDLKNDLVSICRCVEVSILHDTMCSMLYIVFLASATSHSCGGYLGNPSGTLQSPFYPSSYPNNADCVWEIQVGGNIHITLTVQTLT